MSYCITLSQLPVARFRFLSAAPHISNFLLIFSTGKLDWAAISRNLQTDSLILGTQYNRLKFGWLKLLNEHNAQLLFSVYFSFFFSLCTFICLFYNGFSIYFFCLTVHLAIRSFVWLAKSARFTREIDCRFWIVPKKCRSLYDVSVKFDLLVLHSQVLAV